MVVFERVDYFGKEFLFWLFGANDYIRNLLSEIIWTEGLTSIECLPKLI